MNVLETEGLFKTYRGKKGARIEALKGVDFAVAAGEVFGFLGPNGAGKSTTIKILMGLMNPTAGSARIKGVDARQHRARQAVGYLPENPAFYDYLSAEEYLGFVAGVFGMAGERRAARLEEVLRRLDLWDARKRPVRSYSKGMVQRLGIAQTLIHDPDIYVMDEPMSGLDPLGRALVKDLLIELKEKGKCVFFSTHVTADLEEVCDRVAIIVKGELARVAQVSDILSASVQNYQIRYRSAEADGDRVRLVEARELSQTLASIEGGRGTVLLVEPRRQNLEQFFLEIVKVRAPE